MNDVIRGGDPDAECVVDLLQRGFGIGVGRPVRGDAVDQAGLDLTGNDRADALQIRVADEHDAVAIHMVHVGQIVGSAGRYGDFRTRLSDDLDVTPQARSRQLAVVLLPCAPSTRITWFGHIPPGSSQLRPIPGPAGQVDRILT